MYIEVEASASLQALHNWPDAHQDRAYLRFPHAHDFHVTVWARVDHDDRAIEFHDLRLRLESLLQRQGRVYVDQTGLLPNLGETSCEQLARTVLAGLPEVYRVRVAEDEHVAATVERGGRRIATRPPVVTLCGSTRFKDEFREAEARFEDEGVAVFTVGFFAHADGIPISEDQKRRADILHKQKIAVSDFIFVVNPGGYIGSSTRSEIEFAEAMGLPVKYLVEPDGE